MFRCLRCFFCCAELPLFLFIDPPRFPRVLAVVVVVVFLRFFFVGGDAAADDKFALRFLVARFCTCATAAPAPERTTSPTIRCIRLCFGNAFAVNLLASDDAAPTMCGAAALKSGTATRFKKLYANPRPRCTRFPRKASRDFPAK